MKSAKFFIVVFMLMISGCSTTRRARLLEWGADILDPSGAKVEAEARR